MRTTFRQRALTGLAALALLTAGAAACTDKEPTPPPTVDPAPAGTASDSGGAPSSSDSGGSSTGKEPDTSTSSTACKVKEGSDNLPNEAPKVDRWEDVRGVGVPVSDKYGPYEQEGALWSCYEHSPTGAVFAATYVFTAMGGTPGFTETWIPAGDLHDASLEQERTGDAALNGNARILGYRFSSYTPEKAVIEVAAEGGGAEGSAQFSFKVGLIWDGEKWMVSPEDLGPEPVIHDDLSGFVLWGDRG